MLFSKIALFSVMCLYCFSLEASVINFLDLFPQCYESDEMPVVKCNEENQAEVIQFLSKTPALTNGVHIGWSIEFNFKIILARKPNLVILCDINKRVLEFYEVFEKVLLSSSSRSDCLENLRSVFCLHKAYFFNEHSKTGEAALESFSEWLSEEGFQTLRQMYAEGKVLHLFLNVLDKEGKFTVLANWIKENGYLVDTIYASNISNWVQKKEPFFANLAKLVDEQTLFIDAEYQKQKQKKLSLRLTQGTLPWFNPSEAFCDVPRMFQGSELSN